MRDVCACRAGNGGAKRDWRHTVAVRMQPRALLEARLLLNEGLSLSFSAVCVSMRTSNEAFHGGHD